MSKQRTAVILCGGRGTRLGDLGKKLPKTLVKIQGKEILWYILPFFPFAKKSPALKFVKLRLIFV
jgi:NDP-sugar pyrophosphorylase family protein